MSRRKILAIPGSTRSKSSNLSILNFIASVYPERLDVQVYNKISELPHFNPEISDDVLPQEVKEFRRLINEADAVIICTPEYVFSLPGTLKNAIEWTVSTTVFSNKPMALIVASASGEKAFEALKLIMGTIETIFNENTTLLIRGAKGKFTPEGEIKDEALQKSLIRLVDSLIELIGVESQRTL